MEDPLVLKFERSLPRYGRAMQARIRYETALLKRYEGKHIHEFDRVLLLNADDASDYKQLFPQGKFDWVPYGIDTNVFQPTPHIKREDNSIIISGSMYHPPNVEGVLFFCHEVLPRVHQQIPAAQLWVVGANPTDEVKRLAQQEGITVTGSVPDVRDYLCRARVSICPVKLKVGTQTKVLEAMACGTPVVTTSAGNNGIGATSGQHLWVADEPEHIAAQVVSLLRHKNWDAFSETGREFVVQHFAWEHSAARLEEIIQQILIERAKR
jgi:glycosyltransferase involved in cell wall biosynthesis